jgi:ketosteroid isomerase-like protein
MSQENVEIVRRMYDAYARADFDSALSCLDPEIEFSQPADEPGGGTYYGHQGVIDAFAAWTAPWSDYSVEVEALTDTGGHVLARTRHRARGKGSGIDVEHLIFQVWTLRNDKIVRATMYYEEAEALDAAGLRE